MISNATELLKLTSKREGNYHIMKLYNQLYDRSNLIQTILYLPKIDLYLVICYFTYLTFLINLINQFFD